MDNNFIFQRLSCWNTIFVENFSQHSARIAKRSFYIKRLLIRMFLLVKRKYGTNNMCCWNFVHFTESKARLVVLHSDTNALPPPYSSLPRTNKMMYVSVVCMLDFQQFCRMWKRIKFSGPSRNQILVVWLVFCCWRVAYGLNKQTNTTCALFM